MADAEQPENAEQPGNAEEVQPDAEATPEQTQVPASSEPAPSPQAADTPPEAPQAEQQPAQAQEDADASEDEEEAAPREKPAVPGAHLEVDIVPEGVDPLGRSEGYEDTYAVDPYAAEDDGVHLDRLEAGRLGRVDAGKHVGQRVPPGQLLKSAAIEGIQAEV